LPLAGVGFLTTFFLAFFFAIWERIPSRPRPGGRFSFSSGARIESRDPVAARVWELNPGFGWRAIRKLLVRMLTYLGATPEQMVEHEEVRTCADRAAVTSDCYL
jgi:hypothetical protein